jgi:ornithine cyclodeaminase
MPEPGIKFIDAEQVHARLEYTELVEGLRAGHQQDIDLVEHMLLEQPDISGNPTHFLLLPAWQRAQALGVKLVTVFPDNERRATGLPTVQGVYVLFEGTHGRPVACIDGAALTLRKTAGDSALGASYLARADAQSLLMLGAGALASHLIMAHVAVRPSIHRVSVWNRTAARADEMVRRLNIEGVRVDAIDDLQSAVRDADIISCATRATTPLVRGEWLTEGAHLDLVGGYTPDMREADDEAVARSKVFVNSRRFTVGRCGDITVPLAAGIISEGDILADHYDLCRGRHPGRASARDITLFKNGGGGHLDLMTANFLMTRCANGDVTAS